MFLTGMDELMEVSFSPIAATGKPLSRCGKCHRFMKYIQVCKDSHCPKTKISQYYCFYRIIDHINAALISMSKTQLSIMVISNREGIG